MGFCPSSLFLNSISVRWMCTRLPFLISSSGVICVLLFGKGLADFHLLHVVHRKILIFHFHMQAWFSCLVQFQTGRVVSQRLL